MEISSLWCHTGPFSWLRPLNLPHPTQWLWLVAQCMFPLLIGLSVIMAEASDCKIELKMNPFISKRLHSNLLLLNVHQLMHQCASTKMTFQRVFSASIKWITLSALILWWLELEFSLSYLCHSHLQTSNSLELASMLRVSDSQWVCATGHRPLEGSEGRTSCWL